MRFATLVGVGASHGGGGTAYDTAVLADSPVSYWETMEALSSSAAADAADSNPGTYTGSPTMAQAGPGSQGNCGVSLNGSSQYINIPDAANLRIVGNITLELWIKPTNFSNFNYMLDKDGAGGPAPWSFRLEQTTGIPFLLWNGSSPFGVTGSSAPSTGVWSHIAVTLSGTTCTHYLNGSANGSGTMPGSQSGDGGNSVQVGARHDLNSITFFTGLVAKPAIYNTAVSSTRIAAHYAAA